MEGRLSKTDLHFEADDLIIHIPVDFVPGAAITSLTGATVVAYAAPDSGGESVAGTVVIEPSGAKVVARWPKYTLSPGGYTVQVRAEKDGFSRPLIEDRVLVKKSLP